MTSTRMVFSAANIQQRPEDFWLVICPVFSSTENWKRSRRAAKGSVALWFTPFAVTASWATRFAGSR